jgi:hypothetical protein
MVLGFAGYDVELGRVLRDLLSRKTDIGQGAGDIADPARA